MHRIDKLVSDIITSRLRFVIYHQSSPNEFVIENNMISAFHFW